MNDRRPIVIAVLATLVIAAALVAWSWPRGQGPAVASPSPTTTATPTAAATTASATPSASLTATAAAGVLDDRFGFSYLPGSTRPASVVVRSETDAARVATLPPQDRSFVSASRMVSPDGRSMAYWDPLNDRAVLHIREVTGGGDRAVFTAARGMYGGTFAWSSDGTGLVAALDNNCQEICAIQGGTPANELWMVDLVSGKAERIASAGSKVWLPVAWDRAANVVGAGVSGPGGYLTGFDVISLSARPYAVRSTGFQPALCCALGIRASTDERYVLLAWVREEVQWWQVGDPARRSAIPSSKSPAVWRPGTGEIWWLDGSELVSFDVATGTRRVAARGAFGGALVGFRVDGSAAITEDGSRLVFVDLASGRTAFASAGGEFRESVRLR